MIVCVCNALKETQVRASARQCGGRTSQVYSRLGCRAQCGQCVPFMRQLIAEETGSAFPIPA